MSLRASGFALTLLLCARAASAEGVSAEEELRLGVEAHQRGDFEAALEHYRAAHALSPKPALLYAMAQAERARGRCDLAVPLYEAFVAQAENEAQREAARANVERCAADGSASASGSVASGTAAPPANGTEASANGTAPPANAEPLAPGGAPPPETAPAPPTESAPAAVNPLPAEAAAEPAPWYYDPWGGALLVTGTAATLVGTGIWIRAKRDADDARAAARDPNAGDYSSHVDAFDEINARRGTSRWFVIGGSVLIGAAVVRYLTLEREPGAATSRPGTPEGVASYDDGFGFEVTFSGAAATWGGAF